MNPLLKFDTYIPDVEAHVFDDEVYLYGSHDKKGGDRFCMEDYVFYHAKVNNLNEFVADKISYSKKEDPHAIDKTKLVDYYAPDCVKGNDGKYYLYYSAMGPNTKNFGPISVAVSKTPDGPFKYLGDLRYKDGAPVLKFLNNDPAVLNDNGRIYLYYGWGLGRDFSSKVLRPLYNFVLSKISGRSVKEIKNTHPSILDCAFVEIDPSDMLTVLCEPKSVLNSKTSAKKGTELYNHAFYEAPSIRKFNDTYYLIYSSNENGELAYATSKYPDRDFVYRGVVISSGNIGYKGNKVYEDNVGTIHGSVEKIKDEYYVFYHRLTNQSNFERWCYAEKITMNKDGSFNQAEMTTSGITNYLGKGKYEAVRECALFNENSGCVKRGRKSNSPYIRFKKDEYFITNLTLNSVVRFMYFHVEKLNKIKLEVRGYGEANLKIKLNEDIVSEIKISSSINWKKYEIRLNSLSYSKLKIEFIFECADNSNFDFLNFTLI